MTAERVVELLLDLDSFACHETLVHEASVHLPRRGKVWVATFTGEAGEQVWKSTGQRDRAAALRLAKEWEREARAKRAAAGPPPRKWTVRVRPGSPERQGGLLSQTEVAALLKISERAVRSLEVRALRKLRNHPALRQFWREWQGRDIDEGAPSTACQLSRAEEEAILALAQTPFERHVVVKVLGIAGLPPGRKPSVRPPTRM
jgi:hypothetical protein